MKWGPIGAGLLGKLPAHIEATFVLKKIAYRGTDRKLGPARLRAGRQTGALIEVLTGQKRTEVRFNPIYSMQSRF